MGYGSLSGRARTDVNNPKAFAVCDRCSMWYNHCDLSFQFDYRGRTLQNIRILVCDDCNDEPQPQLKPRIIPPDPLPIANARTEPYLYDETDERTTSNPALPNIDLATLGNVLLSGYQIVDGVQVVDGMLILVKNQIKTSENGIYRANSYIWTRVGYDNKTKQWFDAQERGVEYYGQLGYFQGAVNVSRGSQQAQLFQITFDPAATLYKGTPVIANQVPAIYVNHYDFYTGILTAAGDTRATQDMDIRVTQMTGQPIGGRNTLPGTCYLVPGNDKLCPDLGTWLGKPYESIEIPSSGQLAPFGVVGSWYNDWLERITWLNNIGTSTGGFYTYLYGPYYWDTTWLNNRSQQDDWTGVFRLPTNWTTATDPLCPINEIGQP